jgi:hypothetical protein
VERKKHFTIDVEGGLAKLSKIIQSDDPSHLFNTVISDSCLLEASPSCPGRCDTCLHARATEDALVSQLADLSPLTAHSPNIVETSCYQWRQHRHPILANGSVAQVFFEHSVRQKGRVSLSFHRT